MTKQNFDPYEYTVQTELVMLDGDRYFKTTVSELPDLEVYEVTQSSAYDAIIQCIVDLHEAAQNDKRPFPPPAVRHDAGYSGRVTLRMGRDLHRRLDSQANRNGTTLNAEIVSQLSDSSSVRDVALELISQFKQEIQEIVKPITSTSPTAMKVVQVDRDIFPGIYRATLPTSGTGISSGSAMYELVSGQQAVTPKPSVYKTHARRGLAHG